ncbi:secretion protein Por [Bacteroides sp.]
MKKQFLLAAALCSIAFGTTQAQLQTNRSEKVAGFDGAEVLDNGNKRLIITFNTTTGYTNGSEGSNKINCNNLKGLAGAALTTEGISNNVATYLDTYHWMTGTNQGAKFKHYKDVPSLIAAHTVGETLVSTDHRYWKCGNILMDVPETNAKDQAWAVWPGINKRTIMLISFNGSDGMANLCKDIELDLMTLDKGTTGKASAYKMIVITGQNNISLGGLGKACGKEGNDVALLDSINEKNVAAVNQHFGSSYKWYAKDSVYITSADGSLNKQTLKVAETVGTTIKELRGKKLTIILYSTTSETPVQPGMYEPILGVDNLSAEYSEVKWIEPDVVADVKDTLEVNCVAGGEENEIKFVLKTQNRLADLTIVPDGDNKMLTSFNMTSKDERCCIMAYNETTQAYDIPVDYSFTPATMSTPYSIKIPANADGTSVNDNIEVTVFATSRRATTVAYRLEISNGVRIWKDIIATFTDAVSIQSTQENATAISVEGNKIIVKNAADTVTVTDISGRILKTVSAVEAAQGISMSQGIYVVKASEVTQKVLVQ